jgi:hypothetical protein
VTRLNKLIIAAITTLSIGFLIAEGASVVREQKETAEHPEKYLQKSAELTESFKNTIDSLKKEGSDVGELPWLHSMYYNCEGGSTVTDVIGLSDIDVKALFTCSELRPIQKLVVIKNSDGAFTLYTDKAYAELQIKDEKALAERIYARFLSAWALDTYHKLNLATATTNH